MFSALLTKLHRREDLTEAESADAMVEIMEGRASATETAGLLIALSMKGERPVEIVGFARTMREQAVSIKQPFEDVFDTCGTGGDGLRTINVSSLSALIVSACGVRVAKHGNRSVSSSCGSADLFEALGVNVSASPEVVGRCLDVLGLSFFFAPTFHPSMRNAAKARRELGVRTAFNLLGPLTNPARANRQIVGVPRPEYTDLLARALASLGSKRAWVVHGADGLDEISIAGYTKVTECKENSVRTFYVSPSDFGLKPSRLESVRVDGINESVEVARKLIDGSRGPARDLVLANAAAGLFIAGRADSLRSGVRLAERALDSGDVASLLDRWIQLSNEGD